MMGWAEVALIGRIKHNGSICRDPDWPNTFELEDGSFDQFCIDNNAYTLDKDGYSYMVCGPFNVRRSSPDGAYMQKLWKELNEKDSTKSTDI